MLGFIDAYENYLTKIKKASANTVASYMRDIRSFSAWLREQENVEVEDATQLNIRTYVENLQAIGKSDATISRAVAGLRNFYGYLISSGFLEESPLEEIKVAAGEKKDPQILTRDQIRQLLAQPATTDAKGIRDKAMLETLCCTGLRVTELLNLNVEDINLNRGVLLSNHAKKVREIPLSTSAIQALRTYLAKIRGDMLLEKGEKALFVNVGGIRMSRQGFWKLLKRYQQDAGIPGELTPHTLRHSFAVHRLEEGDDLRSLQELMGHSGRSSTQVYSHMVKGLHQN
ncbi:MAG: tyrosine-type recombinase/integrase [Firmicutes bacterium]|nr:tyrosine-type recombinase/integrase [Bacillota bacterium]